jgi:hypothetical protein
MVPLRIEGEVAEQFAPLAQHPDVEVCDQDNDPPAAVGPSDSDVVQPGPVAQGEDLRAGIRLHQRPRNSISDGSHSHASSTPTRPW